MQHSRILFITILLALLLTGTFAAPVTADTAFPAANISGARLLSTDSTGVTFEVNVPWEQLSVEPVSADGREYSRISLPGWSETTQAGSPMLPFTTQQIGLPFGVSVMIQVSPGKLHTQTLSAPVLPVVTQTVELEQLETKGVNPTLPVPSYRIEEDPEVYAGKTVFPEGLAQVANDGILRQQRVVGVTVYPVQYHPETMQLTVYESLRIEVTFGTSQPDLTHASIPESDVYESLLKQELLNYETARQWRRTGAYPPSEVEAVTAGNLPWSPPVPGWRIRVRKNGFYKLTYAELLAAGLPVNSLDPRSFQLYNWGSELAIFVEGEADGSFGMQDYILFYGQGMEAKYSRDNIYWLTYKLTYDPADPSLRMGTQDGTPVISNTPADYMAHRHMEEGNSLYRSIAPGDENLERWLWSRISASTPNTPVSWTYTFSLRAPSAGAGALTISMLGYLSNAINPDHHVIITLNGVPLGESWWDGIAWETLQMTIPSGILVEGDNTLVVTCPNDSGVGMDQVLVDWIELDYPNTFQADSSELAFKYSQAGTWMYRVEGFNTDQVAVYDVTDPAKPVRITGVSVVQSGSMYAALFEDTITTSTDYLTMAPTAYRMVQAIEADTASNLQSMANGADYIVITHKSFLPQAQELSNFRASQGLRAMTIDVQDVYDQFGFGIPGAAPIHDFLAYAYTNWVKPAPSYLVLVGDGHYDPKDYLGLGNGNYIPPYLAPVDPWLGETAADNRYVTLVGADTLPDMMLGRLAVDSSAEATAFINKIILYESRTGDWQKHVLAVADNADSGGNFPALSDALLIGNLPSSYIADKVYLGMAPHGTVTDARAAILEGINAGKLIVNYIGHAAVNLWATEGLFTTTDVAELTNGDMLPVMLSMTCYEGYYLYPYTGYDSLAEVMTRADGKGAVASWSPTGLGVSSGHDNLNIGFFQALFHDPDGEVMLGQATEAGKIKLAASGVNLDLLDTYLLFGDPATKIPIMYPISTLWTYLPLMTR